MDDIEFTALETRLRRQAALRPPVPDELLRFAESVPSRYPRRSPLGLAFPNWNLGRAYRLVATAVAIIVAVTATAAIVNLRGQRAAQGSQPVGSDWAWQRTDDVSLADAFAVAGGYVGICQDPGGSLGCTSRDGIHWTTSSDPTVLFNDSNRAFIPSSVAHLGSLWAAVGMGSGNAGPGVMLWSSRDGQRFSYSAADVFGSYLPQEVGATSQGLVVFANRPGQGNVGSDVSMWSSTDGQQWTREPLPVTVQTYFAGDSGVVVAGKDVSMLGPTTNETWLSRDGKAWSIVHLPPACLELDRIVSLPNGYAGMCHTASGSWIAISSADELTWQEIGSAPDGVVQTMDAYAGRLVVSVHHGTPSSALLWQSADDGATWLPVVGPDGHEAQGQPLDLGGHLALFTWDRASDTWRLSYLGTPAGSSVGGSAPAGPSATPAPTQLLPSSSPRACGDSIPVMVDLDGIRGWAPVYRSETHGRDSCSSFMGVLGSKIAVQATCTVAQTLQVELLDNGPFASFQVDCPIAGASPQVVFRLSGAASLVGDTVQVSVVGPAAGDYEFLVQTAGTAVPAATP
jgi:hypothetical protein